MANPIVDSPANIEFACYHMESTVNSIECKNCPLFYALRIGIRTESVRQSERIAVRFGAEQRDTATSCRR